MLNSKQRAFLRSMSNGLDTVFQIGKNGISDNTIAQFNDYLTAKELVKVNVLKSEDQTPAMTAQIIAEKTGADVVSVTGRRFVLYRKSSKLEKEGKSLLLLER
ncbi:YhbY family RNA-binding protein [Candidatus Nomurabacteria bacterium]|nr:YhbY family RNA-binding protein [Candidatus Nomurabacteria bacterium]